MIFSATAPLSGCKSDIFPAGREIDQFEMVQVVGIDRSAEDPSMAEVTFISQIERGSSGKSEGGIRQVTVKSSTGPTVFDAERKIKAHSDKLVFLGHVDFFIIGEAAAEEDFTKYFDFINRDHEMRLSPKVFIAKGCSAKDLIFNTSSSDKFIMDRLKNIEFDRALLSNIDQVRIIDVQGMLDNTNEATVIPALKQESIRDEFFTGKTPKTDLATGGYAVIRDFKLVGYISDIHSRGYNFLVNKVKSCPVSVKDSSGQYVGLEVIQSKTKVEAHFNGDRLEGITYKTNVMSNIEEQQSRDNIYTQSALLDLASKQSEAIRAEMIEAIDLSKEFKTDCFGLGQEIRMHHPLKWEHIKDNWSEIYPDLKIDVVVESEIERTYDIREPNGYQMEK